MKQKYSEFKKMFYGDTKTNIVAVDKNDNVLAHRAIQSDASSLAGDSLYKVLRALREETGKLAEKIHRYEVVYPNSV